MTYIKNTLYFEVAPTGHTIAYKNIDNLLKNDKYISLFVIQPQYIMVKKCSKFHWSTMRGFDSIKTIYELFDNTSYMILNLTMCSIWFFKHFCARQQRCLRIFEWPSSESNCKENLGIQNFLFHHKNSLLLAYATSLNVWDNMTSLQWWFYQQRSDCSEISEWLTSRNCILVLRHL